MKNQKQIKNFLAQKKLQRFRKSFRSIDPEKKREEVLEKLKIAINNALFLEEARRKKWIAAIDILTTEKAESLLNSILRENLRWKKGTRKIKFDS